MKKLILLVLPWHLLTWADFKGKPCGSDSASSSTTISWSYQINENGCISDIFATPEFNPERSWTITHDPYILKHEQGHLDICKIICDKIFREVNPHETYTEKEFLHLKIKFEKEWDDLDRNYDFKTDHSRNREAQLKWNQWIAEQIKK